MIRVLGEDVRCRLRSGVAVTSVAQCVEELLLNAADAQATCVAVRVDLEIFKVQVVDNGCGLGPEDMERVGLRYCTSKCHSATDLENLRFSGFRGEALASMVDASSVVEISSKHKDTSQTFIRLFQNGKALDVLEAESPRPSAGTTVTLYNLFYNLPVRRKCLQPVLELERIRQRVEAVSLVKPSVSFSLRNDAVHSVLLQLPKTKDPRSRFCQIYGVSRCQGLREVQHTQRGVTMDGLISREGHYNRTMQFLYVNSRLVLKTKLHKLMDFIIRKESSVCRWRSSPGRPRAAADLHGIFMLNIHCPGSHYDISFQPDKTFIEFQDWDSVMLCVERGLKTFLKRENLFLEPSKDDIAEFSQKHNYNLSCNELQCEGGDEPVPPQDSRGGIEETSHSANLTSKCVLRGREVTVAGSPLVVGSHNNREVCDQQELPEGQEESLLTPPGKIPQTAVVSWALSSAGAMNEGTTSSVPQNPRSPSTGSDPLGMSIWKSAACKITPISANNTSKEVSSEKCSRGPEPTHIQLRGPGSRGSLDKFRRHYGKSCLVGKECREPQLPKSPTKSESMAVNHPGGACHSASIPYMTPAQGTAHPSGDPKLSDHYVDSKQGESPHPQSTLSLTTKLCRLKNNMEEASCPVTSRGVIHTTATQSNICEDGARRSPCEQQAPLNEGAQMSDNSPNGSMSHQWLQCYEESLGKNVFINTATGLSSYSAPSRDKTAACTKDLSNMSVNVVCSNGFQYACHPFKSPTLLPFLPRPRDEGDPAPPTDDGALSSMYTKWKNPVYVRHPSLAVDVSREHSDTLSVKIYNILYSYRFTKEMVHSMKVLQQVDSKFIACLMSSEAGQTTASGGNLLVLVDQHAAHERVRLEQLIADSFEASSETCERSLKVSVVDPALEVHVSEEEYRLLRTRAGTLRRVGLSLSFPDPGSPRVLVSEIPLCFVEREANEMQRGRTPVVRRMVEEYLQEQVQLLQVPGAGHRAVPGTVLKVLASQACHGAVKFNHPLTGDECSRLMASLAQCSLPFQCAHGRPSILPLADLQHMDPEVPPPLKPETSETTAPNLAAV
ncbi:DNA mismatch repair protein Mlh3-like [Rhinoderma darwinii]|uniref:DNA mismatch repair protein Mlh3-like n=1 Tax=Rhinoderma darwinii TaxID=43563 RepID=UPI003F6791D6